MRNSLLPAVALGLTLAACGPLVQIGGNVPAPAALLTLHADVVPAAATPRSARTVAIALPVVPGALRTLRMPVTTADTQLQYLKDASWIEQPNKLFQRLLLDVVAVKADAIALDDRNFTVAPERRIDGDLLEFGVDLRGSPMVRVRYDATLTSNTGKLLAARSFTATQPLPAQTPDAAAVALNAAANSVAGDVAAWVAAN